MINIRSNRLDERSYNTDDKHAATDQSHIAWLYLRVIAEGYVTRCQSSLMQRAQG